MHAGNRVTKILTIVVVPIFVFGCSTDMNIRNDNDPNTKSVLATPSDYLALLGGSFLEYWSAWEKSYPSMPTAVLADIMQSPWGNWGMRDISREPRIPFNNDPSYQYKGAVETPWYGTYRALSQVTDVARALSKEEISFSIEEQGIDNNAAWAFIQFMRGISYGSLGLFFDKGFIFDEHNDLPANARAFSENDFSTRDELVDTGIDYLIQAIELCDNEFILPGTWINGYTPANTDIKKWSHALIARFEAQRGRTQAESAASDWNLVLEHIEKGITQDMAPEGDNDVWWKRTIERSGYSSWVRADMKILGMTDVSENYKDWLDTPPANRQSISIFTQDRRITESIDDPQSDGLYFEYNGWISFRRHVSFGTPYVWHRYDYHRNPAVGPMPWITVVEMDMLRAEALLMTKPEGYKVEVVNLINKTRVANGQMTPLFGTEPENELWKWMIYEKRIEDGLHHAGGGWYDMRRWDTRTQDYIAWAPDFPRSFPVPGVELELLLLDSYTFGGSGLPATKVGYANIDADYIQGLRTDLEKRNRIDRESGNVLNR